MSNLPENVVIALILIIALVVIIVPLALRIGGLTGQQVVDVITLTLQFFINIVREFRAQNKPQ